VKYRRKNSTAYLSFNKGFSKKRIAKILIYDQNKARFYRFQQ
jgi:hypothetical protein